jgi:hypothetical protein
MKAATLYLLGFLFLGFVAWLLESSQLLQSCISDGKNHVGDEALQNKVSIFVSYFWVYRRCLGTYVIERNAGITALFTVVLGVSTIFLWIVTNKAAEAAKVAAEHIPTVEGAYVYVLLKKETVEEDLQMIGIGTGLIRRDFMIQVQLSLKNFGKTPAVIERFTARLSYGGAKPISSGVEARVQSNTIIGAGVESEPPLIVSAPVLSKADVEKIWRDEASLTLDGTLVYRDIWGDEWTVPFNGRNHFDAPINHGNVGVGFRIDNYSRQKNS